MPEEPELPPAAVEEQAGALEEVPPVEVDPAVAAAEAAAALAKAEAEALEAQILEAWDHICWTLKPYLSTVGYPTDVSLAMMIALTTKAVAEEASTGGGLAFASSAATIVPVAEDVEKVLQLETEAHKDTMHERHMQVRESEKYMEQFERLRATIEKASKREAKRLAKKKADENRKIVIKGPDKGEGEAAVKVLFPLFRKDGTSKEQFFKYWQEPHSELVQSLLQDLGAYKYEQLERLPGASKKRYGASKANPGLYETCDGVAIVWWQDIETKERASLLAKARRAAKVLHDDEKRFLDMQKSHSFLSEMRFSGSFFALPPAMVTSHK